MAFNMQSCIGEGFKFGLAHIGLMQFYLVQNMV